MVQSPARFGCFSAVFLLVFCSLGVSAATKPVPELPRAYVDTTWNPPVGGTTWNAHTGAQLSADLAAAHPGDTIVLDAGTVYSGNFTLPAKVNPTHKWIYIQSSALSSLPGPGVRVGPSDAAHMPKLVNPNASPTIRVAPGADHWRLVGLEIASASTYGCNLQNNPPINCWSYYLIQSTRGILSDALADSITVDRCYVHGSDTQDVTHAVNIDGSNFAVIDSYVSEIHGSMYDSQAIGAFFSNGPYKIVNNFLSATTEDVMFGGSGGFDSPYVPSDIEIRRNHLFKPLRWQKCGALGTVAPGEKLADGSTCPSGVSNQWVEKNNLEFKSGRRVVVTGNVLENTWVSGQTGSSVLFTVRTAQSGAGAVVDDITFQSNILRNVDRGISAIEFDDTCHLPSCTNPGESKRVWVDNNLFLLRPSLDTYQHNWATLGAGLTDYVFQHNTMLMSDQSPMWSYVFSLNQQYGCTPPSSSTYNVWILDNAITRQPTGDCGWEGLQGLQIYMGDPAPVDPRYLGNAMFVSSGDTLYSFPAHNLATRTPFGYQNQGVGDYQLVVPNWTDTSDGAIAGIDWNSLQAAMNPSGQFSTLPPCRVIDTRNPTGPLGAPPLQPHGTRTFDVTNSPCGIPADAVAISANLTVTNVGAQGELVVFPADVLRPNTSALSFRGGLTRANNAIVSFSKSITAFSVFNNSAGTMDFILDVNGFFQ